MVIVESTKLDRWVRMFVFLFFGGLGVLCVLLIISLMIARPKLDNSPRQIAEIIEINHRLCPYPLWRVRKYLATAVDGYGHHFYIWRYENYSHNAYHYDSLMDQWNRQIPTAVIEQIKEERYKFGLTEFSADFPGKYYKLPYRVNPLRKKPCLIILREASINPEYIWPFSNPNNQIVYCIYSITLETPSQLEYELVH